MSLNYLKTLANWAREPNHSTIMSEARQFAISTLFVLIVSVLMVTEARASHCDVTVTNAAQLHAAITPGGASPGDTVCVKAVGSPYIPEIERDENYSIIVPDPNDPDCATDPGSTDCDMLTVDLSDRTKTFVVRVNDLTLKGDGIGSTILSGDLGVMVDKSDNAFNVIFVDETAGVNKLTVKDMTITQGNADIFPSESDPNPPPNAVAAGIFMPNVGENARLTIKRVHFNDNVALGPSAILFYQAFGQQVVYPDPNQPTAVIKDSKFTNNNSVFFNITIDTFYTNLNISYSHFIDNVGGVLLDEGTGSIVHNEFINNRVAGSAGALQTIGFDPQIKGDISISHNLFEDNGVDGDNSPFNRGGAILIEGLADSLSFVRFHYNQFINNSSTGLSGAVDILNANTEIKANYFKNNTAGNTGGAITMTTLPLWFRPGVEAPTTIIKQNIFTGNESGIRGGALHYAQTHVPPEPFSAPIFEVEDNLFLNNKAAEHGGAIAVDTQLAKLKNNLYIGNRAQGVSLVDPEIQTGNGGAVSVVSALRHQGFFQTLQSPAIDDAENNGILINFVLFTPPPNYPWQGSNDPNDIDGSLTQNISSAQIEDSIFIGNYALKDGGAIADLPNIESDLFGPGFTSLVLGVFDPNTGEPADLASVTSPGLGQVEVKDSYFAFNKADEGVGGAIVINGAGQKENYNVCPFGVEAPVLDPSAPPGLFFWQVLDCEEDPNQDPRRAWVPDLTSDHIYSTISVVDSLIILNHAGRGGADGDDVFVGSQIPVTNVDVSNAIIGDCDGC